MSPWTLSVIDTNRKCNELCLHCAQVSKLCITRQSKVMAFKSKEVAAEWPYQENGVERIDTALIKVGLCYFKCVLKSCIGPNGLWAVKNNYDRRELKKKKKKKKLITKIMTPRWWTYSPVISWFFFQRLWPPFVSGSQLYFWKGRAIHCDTVMHRLSISRLSPLDVSPFEMCSCRQICPDLFSFFWLCQSLLLIRFALCCWRWSLSPSWLLLYTYFLAAVLLLGLWLWGVFVPFLCYEISFFSPFFLIAVFLITFFLITFFLITFFLRPNAFLYFSFPFFSFLFFCFVFCLFCFLTLSALRQFSLWAVPACRVLGPADLKRSCILSFLLSVSLFSLFFLAFDW